MLLAAGGNQELSVKKLFCPAGGGRQGGLCEEARYRQTYLCLYVFKGMHPRRLSLSLALPSLSSFPSGVSRSFIHSLAGCLALSGAGNARLPLLATPPLPPSFLFSSLSCSAPLLVVWHRQALGKPIMQGGSASICCCKNVSLEPIIATGSWLSDISSSSPLLLHR